MGKGQKAAEDKIKLVMERLTGAEVDALVADAKTGEDVAEFKAIAEAVMAWYQLLMASGVVRSGEKAIETLASSMVVLGTLVKYTYALGVRRGKRPGASRSDSERE